MKASFLALCALTLCLQSAFAAKYPSTYPWDNESFTPPSLPAGEPDFTYGKDDPGGYAVMAMNCDLNDPKFFDDWLGDAYDFCGHGQHWLKVSYQITQLAPANFNCSYTAPYTSSWWSGVINGKTVCNAGECCSALIGQPTYADMSADIDARIQTLADLSATGLCDTISEPAMCHLANGNGFLCIQQYVTAGDRLYILSCMDSVVIWYTTCTTYMLSGLGEVIALDDTELYRACLTPIQSFMIYAVGYNFDRVCHPYSYYYPDFIFTLDGYDPDESKCADDDKDDDKDDKDDKDSSASFVKVGLALMSLIATVM